MNAVERQNRGGHVKEWRVFVTDSLTGLAAARVVAAQSREEAMEAGREFGIPAQAFAPIDQQVAADALLWARRALAQARAEAGRTK